MADEGVEQVAALADPVGAISERVKAAHRIRSGAHCALPIGVSALFQSGRNRDGGCRRDALCVK